MAALGLAVATIWFPGWPWACELSIEVLTSYEMAEVVGIGDGYDLGLDLVTA